MVGRRSAIFAGGVLLALLGLSYARGARIGGGSRPDDSAGPAGPAASPPDATRERADIDANPPAALPRFRQRHWWHASVGGVRDPVWYYEEYCMAVPDAHSYLVRAEARGIDSVPPEFQAGQARAMATAKWMVSQPWSPACEWLHADTGPESRVSAL